MSKYLLKPEFINCDIHTKTSDGTEILVTASTFNDYFGELMFKNGQQHLLNINPEFVSTSEKKTFTQITDTHILLISKPDLRDEKEQSVIVDEPKLKRKPGRQPKVQE